MAAINSTSTKRQHKTISVDMELLGILEDYPDIKEKLENQPDADLATLLQEKLAGTGDSIQVTVNGPKAHIVWAVNPAPVQAEQLNRQALQLAQKKEYMEAVDLWKKVLDIYSNDPDVYYNLALVYHEMKMFHQSLDCCIRTIAICPVYYRAFNLLGSIYSKMRRFDKAEEYIKTSLRFSVNNLQALVNLGAVFSILKKYSDAVKAFEKAISINPKEARAYLGLGKVYMISNDYENARRCYTAVLKLDTSGKLGQLAQSAIQMIDQQNLPEKDNTKKNETDMDQNVNIKGYEYFLKNDLKNAVQEYQYHLQQYPNDSEAWASLANCQIRAGQSKEAIESIQKAISIVPKGGYYKQAAIILDACGLVNEAGGAAQKAHELGKTDSITKTLIAKNLVKSGKLEEAMRYLQEAIQLNSSNITARFQFAQLLKKLGHLEASKQQFEEILWCKNDSPLKELAQKEIKGFA
ncbi:tetratricopeptide repeat protein [candidate division KSB1 bacterium]|nr:tetratricopeptide repeat protein [candidate division KSB1 bacterium]